MTNLPVEALHRIFNSLGQRDQLTCMTVCKQWHNILFDHIFFRVVSLTSTEQLTKLEERVKDHPKLSQRVERVLLKLDSSNRFDGENFAKFFPNVRVLEKYSYYNSQFKPNEQHPWCKSMEQIVEHKTDYFTKTLLSSGLCNNLINIVLDGQDASASDLINALANAPGLLKLQLNSYKVSLDDLELLHKSAPLLTSLHMDRVRFISDSKTTFPANIEPATSMKSFMGHISDLSYGGTAGMTLLRYVSQKYTCLEELGVEYTRYDDYGYGEEGEQTELLTSTWKNLGPRLKTFSINFVTLKDEIPLFGYDRNEEFRRCAYEDDNLGITFDFDTLDELGCQIKKWSMDVKVYHSLLTDLKKSKQAEYIQSLTVRQLLFQNEDGLYFYWLRGFPALRELSLDFSVSECPDEKPSIVELFNVMAKRNLETLEVSHMYFNVLASSDGSWPSIKNLTFNECDFVKGTDLAISKFFPNLKRLKINKSLGKTRSLVLSNLNLSYLELSNVITKTPLTALVVTLNDKQKRFYTASKPSSLDSPVLGTDIFPRSSLSSKPYNPSTDTPYLTITCKSLSNFFMTESIYRY